MRADYSRKTFDRRKHYSGVLMQQGRVQVDADWNEQLDVQLYRTETESIDVIGASGVPKTHGGFKIGAAPGGHDLTISAGRMYVDGLLCELDESATYTTQPHFPNPDSTAPAASPADTTLQLTLVDGAYLVFLDVWQREITARDHEHRHIREVALGGPDTAARLQTVYQVKLLALGPSSPLSPLTCDSPLGAFDQYVGLSTGTMNARTDTPQPQSNPCVLPPSAGYSRLENQLYRVQIHTPGSVNQATFKWARDTVETTIEAIAGNVATVADVGPDEVLGFGGQQWVEVVDDESTLKGVPNPLFQIDKVDPDTREITLKNSLVSLPSLASRKGLKLRRWDQSGASASATGVNAPSAPWIDLEGGIQVQFSATGHFRSGDFWLIPARTVTGAIEWPTDAANTTIAQPPRGVRHHYARLALVDVIGGTVVVREDCRKPFPALTEICAEDVCFENDTCQLAGAETVQDAIDRLCQERDLRFHKKYLHGWGIVCGLQVHCGPGSRSITVKKGYAISCEGDDIRIADDDSFDLFDLVASTIGFPAASPLASPLAGVPDTEVCLILDSSPSSTRRYRVERFTGHQSTLKSILEGTLLLDVFNDCIQSLVDFVKQETTPQPAEANLPVGPTQKRITTFLNLLVQLWDPNGPFVFLSGDSAQSGPNFEDTILRQFYTRLRAKLQSHTFCAMFDGARQFPAYPYTNSGITTIFSKGRKTRIRVAPNSRVGYEVGAGNTINVFDLTTDEMVQELVFPGAPNVIVQDVAVARNGSQLYAVATLNNKDTMFVIADITGNGLTHTFRVPTIICDVQLVTLGIAPAPSLNVLAIGKGKGLYDINPQNPVNPANPNAPIPAKYSFNAIGHLVVDGPRNMGYATLSSGTTATDTYDRVRKMNLAATSSTTDFSLNVNNQQLTGEDDIAFATSGQQRKLYVVVNPPTGQSNKHVLVYDADNPATAPTVTNLQQDTTIRLAHNATTNHMMVTYEDIYRVGMLNPQDALVADFVPVQIGPVWITQAPDNSRVYVVNYWSNTISVIRSSLFATGQQIAMLSLVTYRAGVLNAFVDLFGGLLQYLKDCFCDHLLVDCPTCDENDKIYLACISIKNNKVHKICNFSHRKYVHSFPTWEYWLSAVPILPFLKKAVEEICCAALPGLFARYNAPAPAVPVNTTTAPKSAVINSGPLRRGAMVLDQADVRGTLSERLMKIRTGGGVINDAIVNMTRRTFAEPPPLAHSDVVGHDVADARTKLTAGKIVVAEEVPYDPRKAGNLARFATAPVRLQEGDRVNLVTKDGKVLFYTRAGEALPDTVRASLDASAADALQLRQEVNTLRTELLQVRQAHQADLQARDAQIVALQTSIRDAQINAQAVRDMRERVERLERRPPP